MNTNTTDNDTRHSRVQSGPVSLAVQSRGDDSRPTVILIHGYPDTSAIWNEVADRLACQFHVVTYDVRGAGQSEAPWGINPYRFEYLVDDLAAVADAVCPQRPFHLVGYDWGALQGWEALASARLEHRIASFSTAAPSLSHVGIWFQRRVQNPSPRNLAELIGRSLGSSYMAALNLPILPEMTWRLAMGRLWPWFLKNIEQVERHPEQTLVNDGVQGLSLYRANMAERLLKPCPEYTEVPVQALLLTGDRFVPPQMMAGLEEWAPNLTRTEIAAGHWGVQTHPEAFAAAIGEFVKQQELVLPVAADTSSQTVTQH